MSLYIGNTQIGKLIVGTQNVGDMQQYSGSYTVTPSYSTQTLDTDGTYLMNDITINPMVFDFRGKNVEFWKTFYPKTTVALKDTDYNGWTPSTTAKAIVASTSLDAISMSMGSYDYLIRWRFRFDAAYNSGATLKNQLYRECNEIWQYAFKRTNSVANISTTTRTYNSLITLYSAPLLVYYGNTTNTLTYTHSVSYGIYPTVQSATWGNATNDTVNLTIKTPIIYAKCNATQFATARASQLDQTNSKFILQGDLYKLEKSSSPLSIMTESLYDIYNNGIN